MGGVTWFGEVCLGGTGTSFFWIVSGSGDNRTVGVGISGNWWESLYFGLNGNGEGDFCDVTVCSPSNGLWGSKGCDFKMFEEACILWSPWFLICPHLLMGGTCAVVAAGFAEESLIPMSLGESLGLDRRLLKSTWFTLDSVRKSNYHWLKNYTY